MFTCWLILVLLLFLFALYFTLILCVWFFWLSSFFSTKKKEILWSHLELNIFCKAHFSIARPKKNYHTMNTNVVIFYIENRLIDILCVIFVDFLFWLLINCNLSSRESLVSHEWIELFAENLLKIFCVFESI